MNKLSKHIKPLLETDRYRGIDLYQHSRLVDDIELITFVLQYIFDNGNEMPCKQTDPEYVRLSEIYGWETTVIRKNLFPDLNEIGLISRCNSGKNWSKVCITDAGINFLRSEDKRLSLEMAHRTRKSTNTQFCEFIQRLEFLVNVNQFGQLFWWEVWMCMRLDVNFEEIKKIIKEIRAEFKLKKNSKFHIETVTKMFLEHNRKGVKQNGSIDFTNIINKVNSFGIKATFFFFKVDNSGQYIIFRSQFCTSQNKVSRTYSRTNYILKKGIPSDFDYHHIIPFDYAHYHPNFHYQIDSEPNLIPLTKTDHSKFPNKSNLYVKLVVENNKVRFFSIEEKNDFIELENIDHLDLDKIKKEYQTFNSNLIKKIFE